MKTYLIIKQTEDFKQLEYGLQIPHKQKPTLLHTSRLKALQELKRLKSKFPESRFFLYESILEVPKGNGSFKVKEL